MIIYHYTTKRSFDDIKRTGELKSSRQWTIMDAPYGKGLYFTDLTPAICDMAIAFYCWRNTAYTIMKRIDYYLKFNIDPKVLSKTREHVYMVQEWDNESIRYLGGGKKERCALMPCDVCDKAKLYRL